MELSAGFCLDLMRETSELQRSLGVVDGSMRGRDMCKPKLLETQLGNQYKTGGIWAQEAPTFPPLKKMMTKQIDCVTMRYIMQIRMR